MKLKTLILCLCSLLLICALLLFGAANLTIVSASLAADGVTYSLTMSQSGLTASGITACFTLHGVATLGVAAPSFTVNNGTGSGSVVTFTTNLPAYTTDTVTIDIATVGGGCNLTGTSGANTPQGQTGVAVTNNSEWHGTHDAAMSAVSQYDGGPFLGTNSAYPNAATWNNGGGDIAVNATGSAISVLAFGASSQYSLIQDTSLLPCPSAVSTCITPDAADYPGVNNATLASASNVWSIFIIGNSLSGTHLYRIIPQFCVAQACIVSAVRFTGGGPTGSKPTARNTAVQLGDSDSGCGGGGPHDCLQYDLPLLAYANPMGFVTQVQSRSGEACATINTRWPFMGTADGSTPAFAVAECGSQDVAGGTSIPTFTATYEAGLCDMMNIAGCGDGNLNPTPPTQGYAKGIIDLQAGNAAVPYNAAIQAAVAAVNLAQGTNIIYYDASKFVQQTSGTCDGTHDFISDTFHACGALDTTQPGFGRVANGEYPVFYTTINGGKTFSVTGPSTGTQGQTSTAFTATLVGNSVGIYWGLGGTPTVTSSDSGATLCITGQGCAVGSLALASGTAGGTFQFTIKPSIAGAITISYGTNLPLAWVVPTSNTFTASMATPVPNARLTGLATTSGKATIQ